MNKAIGGYLELELISSFEYHLENSVALNTARNCFEYILTADKYKKLYIPYYICEVMFETLHKLSLSFEFYRIDKNLEPVFNFSKIKTNELFLYVNYFGIKDKYVETLSKLDINLIIDNAQSFFSKPIENTHAFYSARKFIGVGDGGYLYTNKKLDVEIEQDVSFNRMGHLLKRIDTSAEDAYQIFVRNEENLSNQPIMKMSNLTKKILSGVDYDSIKRKRQDNFNYLHQFLKSSNLLKINKSDDQVPLIYPYWTSDMTLRAKLQNQKVYCPTYWASVLNNNDCRAGLEHQLAKEIIPLPIDQRYNLDDMTKLIEVLHK